MGWGLLVVLGVVVMGYVMNDWFGGKLLKVKEYFGLVFGNDWHTTIFSCVDGTIILCLMLTSRDTLFESLFRTGFGDSLFLYKYLDSYNEEDMPFLWLDGLLDLE